MTAITRGTTIVLSTAVLLLQATNTLSFQTSPLHQPLQKNSHRCRPLFSENNADNGDSDSTESISMQERNSRRGFLSSAVAAASALPMMLSSMPPNALAEPTASAAAIATPAFNKDISWPLGKIAFSLLPLAGTSTRRATVEECIVPDQIWTHDQIQGVVNVNVPVRQTVVKLSKEAGGGLLIYNPIAPTPQVIEMVKKLEATHGPVRHLVLGTVALEHKATFGAFAENFPDATVWLQPGQWSFPLPVSVEFLGVTQRGKKLREIPLDDGKGTVYSKQYEYYAKKDPIPEWAVDFDWETLGPLQFKSVGAFSETVMFHKKTKSLILTDVVVSVTKDPPKIIQEDPRAMLFHARDSIEEVIEDTKENREKGWRRMVQFGLVFFPSEIDVVPAGKAISQASKIDKSMKPLGDGAVPFSLYPWTWHENDADLDNFEAISKNGEIFCPPILTKLILDRENVKTLEFVDRVASRFDFERIIPCHLNNNVKATPAQFRTAFEVLANDRNNDGNLIGQRPLAEDLALLQKASDILTDFGVVGKSLVCDGEPARRVGRFATK